MKEWVGEIRFSPEKIRTRHGLTPQDVREAVSCEADTKLVPAYYIGKRDAVDGFRFMTDLAGRLKHRVQLSSDGHSVYLRAVEGVFGSEIVYAIITKLYGPEPRT